MAGIPWIAIWIKKYVDPHTIYTVAKAMITNNEDGFCVILVMIVDV
jgi:hypothetical protein